MNFLRRCAFVLLLYISTICKTQGFNFNACSSTVNDRLNVTYGSLSVECNTKYDRLSVTSPPKISFPHAVQGKFYEVVMIDPDAPSAANPTCRSWLHMMLSDVKGSDLQNGVFADGLHGGGTVTEYNPPTPPKGKGYHRYILAAFSHKEPLNLNRENIITKRCGFDIDLFTERNHLHQTPDASIMFQTITE